MRKFILAGSILFFLAACNTEGSGDQGTDTTMATGGGDPSQGSGAGGNTNNIGTDTMRTITMDTTGRDTSRRDTGRRDTMR